MKKIIIPMFISLLFSTASNSQSHLDSLFHELMISYNHIDSVRSNCFEYFYAQEADVCKNFGLLEYYFLELKNHSNIKIAVYNEYLRNKNRLDPKLVHQADSVISHHKQAKIEIKNTLKIIRDKCTL